MARSHTGPRKAAITAAHARQQVRREAQAYARERARELAGDSQYTGEELRQQQHQLKADFLARSLASSPVARASGPGSPGHGSFTVPGHNFKDAA